jgi:tetratricopeptide (TPR) repeat protein
MYSFQGVIMKMAKILLIHCIFLMLFSCGSENSGMMEELLETEEGQYEGKEIDRSRIAELEAALNRFDEDVQRRVQDTGQLGIYYRILATDLMEKEMYGPALEALERALEIYPANRVLFYRAGVCRGFLAKTLANGTERERGISEAMYYYERAIELDPAYEDALYGAAVLSLFESDDLALAEEKIIRLLDRYPDNVRGLFLLANLRIQTRDRETAAAIYKRIIDSKQASEREIDQARVNRNALLGGAYE